MKKKAAGKKSASAKRASGGTAKHAMPARTTTAHRKVARTAPPRAAAVSADSLLPPLEALLHTMRVIAQHEDELCTLLHDARRSGRLNSALRRELQTVLALLPAEDFAGEVHAVTLHLR